MRHPDPQTLQRFADGELRGRRNRKVSAHLDACSECAEAVERIQATGDMLRLGFDEMLAEAPLESFADNVMAKVEEHAKPLPWTERLRAWAGEFVRYRRKVWVPSVALAGTAAAALVIAVAVGGGMPTRELPTGSSVISVSFGSSVDGTVFELEDKDGTTTAVIWVDESKAAPNDSEACRDLGRSGTQVASKSKRKSTSAVTLAARLAYWGASGAKTT